VVLETIAQTADIDLRQFSGACQCHGSRDIFSSGASLSFMPSSELNAANRRTLFDIQGANALRGVQFVATQRIQMDAKLSHIDGHPPRCLNAIAMQINSSAPRDRRYLPDGLQRTDFVVRVHQRDQYRFGPKALNHLIYVNNAVVADCHSSYSNALSLKLIDRTQHRRMLNRAGNQMLVRTRQIANKPQNGKVIRFRPATSKHNLIGRRAEKLRYHSPGTFERLARVLPRSKYSK